MPLSQVLSLGVMGVQLKPNYIFSQSIGPWQVQNWTTSEGYEVLLPLDDEIQELLDDFYHYEEERHCLRGERGGRTWRLGDRLTVQLASVNVGELKVELVPVRGA